MTIPTDDRDLEEYLAGGSEISRRYRALSQEQPSRTLDRAVLVEARGAGAPPPKVTAFTGRRVRWMFPFAAAATVLLSVAIFRDAGMNSQVGMNAPVQPVAADQTIVTAAVDVPAPESVPILAAEAAPPAAPEIEKKAAVSGAAAPQTNALASARIPEEALRESNIEPLPLPPPPPPPPVAARLYLSAPAPAAAEILVRNKDVEAFRSETAALDPSSEEERALAAIRLQLAAGRKTQARHSLQAFLKAHPDYFASHPEAARSLTELRDLLPPVPPTAPDLPPAPAP